MSSNPQNESLKVGERVSIFRRGKIWQATYQLNGRQHRKSLKTTNKKEAILRGQRLEGKIDNGEATTVIVPAGIREAVGQFLEHAEAEGRARKTLVKYRDVTTKILALADCRNIARVDQIDLRFADAFRKALHKNGLAQKTIYNSMVILRSLGLFVFRRKLCAADGLAGIRLNKPKPTPQPVWSPEEAERILKALAASYVGYATFLRDTGCRAGEAKYLTWNDIDLSRSVAHIRPKEGWRPKSGDQRTVPLTPRLRTMLAKQACRNGWVFTAPLTPQHPNAGRQISERRALQALKRALKALGLTGHLHTFRHTFISQALTRGVPEAVVREWVGHVDPAILRLYTHISAAVSSSYLERFTGE